MEFSAVLGRVFGGRAVGDRVTVVVEEELERGGRRRRRAKSTPTQVVSLSQLKQIVCTLWLLSLTRNAELQ